MLKISDVEPATALNGLFTDGSVAGGISPTRLVAAFFNALQTELVNIVETSGMELDKDDSTQVLKALHKTFLQRINPFADIKADGAAAIAAALANLGIVDASTTQKGLVRLTSSLVSGAEDIAATANAAGLLYTLILALQNKTKDATETNKGILRISTDRNDLSADAYLIAGSKAAASLNYRDIQTTFGQIGNKGRALGVTYTNTQAMTIFVYVCGQATEGATFLSATINGQNITGNQSANIAGQRICIAFMVPAGATYQTGISAGTLSNLVWMETDKK